MLGQRKKTWKRTQQSIYLDLWETWNAYDWDFEHSLLDPTWFDMTKSKTQKAQMLSRKHGKHMRVLVVAGSFRLASTWFYLNLEPIDASVGLTYMLWPFLFTMSGVSFACLHISTFHHILFLLTICGTASEKVWLPNEEFALGWVVNIWMRNTRI